MFNKIKNFIISHKIISIIILILLIFVIYRVSRSKTVSETRYITSEVSKGNVISSVSGTGQIEATNTITLKTKTSGDINYIAVKAGETVKRGQLIASVDSSDAKIALENAQISLDKLTEAPDATTLTQKQNSLEQDYNNGWNLVSSTFLSLNPVLDSMDSLYSSGYLSYSNISSVSNTIKSKVLAGQNSYYDSQNKLDKVSSLYKTLSRNSSKKDIENLISQTKDAASSIASSVKLSQEAFDAVVNYKDDNDTTSVNNTQSNLTSWASTTNSSVSNLLSSMNSITEDTQSLNDFLAGSNSLDIKSAKLNLDSKQQAYNDCFLYAPFDGVIATLTAKVGDSGSSIGTLITNEEIATISLNEVDIAKVKLGQKATLTFDAIDGLTITGVVSGIDSVGTVSQGVVSYNVEIALDVKDERVKPGMSVSATIITDTKEDVLTVPNSAIKTSGDVNYVETFTSPLSNSNNAQGSVSSIPPTETEVTTGLSDDTNTEITSGLKEGDIIVTKTITGTTSKSSSSAPSIFGAVGGSRTGAGALRSIRD